MCITQHYTINFYITDTSDKRQNPQAKTFKSRNGVDDNPSYDPENNAPRIRRRLLLSPAGETWVRRSPLPRPPTPPQFSLSSHHAHIPLWTIFFYINSSQAGTHLCVIVIAFFSPKCAITWKWSWPSSTSSSLWPFLKRIWLDLQSPVISPQRCSSHLLLMVGFPQTTS